MATRLSNDVGHRNPAGDMYGQIAFPHPRRQRRIGFVERGTQQPQIQIRKFSRSIPLAVNHVHGSAPSFYCAARKLAQSFINGSYKSERVVVQWFRFS